MTTPTLVKVVRDPRSGEIHLPREQVAIVSVSTQPRSHLTEGEVAGWR